MRSAKTKVFISGGAGFIGSNAAKYCIDRGMNVVVFDNLSRPGTERNLAWLKKVGKGRLRFIRGDIRNPDLLQKSLKGSSVVIHEAAQVALTTSIENPIADFEVNALGTLYMLEATRKVSPGAPFIYASTNKVYGQLDDLDYLEGKNRYHFKEKKLKSGIDESRPLDFHSPYGCSKGAGDQYVHDYHRTYGLPTVVFRQSTIYGPRQFGNEDQGFVIYLTRRALNDKKITIYGDGKQVRDILFVDDLINAYFSAIEKIDDVAGSIFNIGGGYGNSISLLDLLTFLERNLSKKIDYDFGEWREGDQKIFISNNNKLKKELGWEPKVTKEKGLEKLIAWAKTI